MPSATRLTGSDLKGIQSLVDKPQDKPVMGDEAAIIGFLIDRPNNAAQPPQAARRAQPALDVRVLPPGDRLRTSIRENGHGNANEAISRVFEPFFATRELGSGLGLSMSMSMSHSIVQRHGGVASVNIEPGTRTDFSFDLALA